MMKKNVAQLIIAFFFTLMIVLPVFAKDNDEWKQKPVITNVYELTKEKMLIEWEGNASLYQVYVDGKQAASVNLPTTVIDVKGGMHQITVMPVSVRSKEGDKNFSFNFNTSGLADILRLLNVPVVKDLGNINVGLDMDLSAFGIDPKDLIMGDPSETVKINYTPNAISAAVPEILGAYTDFDERVMLSFTDKYESNIYRICIKNGKDTTYAEFDVSTDDAAPLITKDKSRVTVILDPGYLEAHGCMVPELDQKYSFSVKLQKWLVDFIDGSKETNIVLESKESKAYDYTPYAAWKNEPVITYASQSADGQITLRWDHDDNGLGCEYKIMEQDILLGVKKGEGEIGRTSEKEFTVNDLMNGKYTYAVIPVFSGDEGSASDPVTAEVKNNWVAAPALKCEAENSKDVRLKWTASEGVESYHITVSAGDGSLLRFVKLDYKKYEEFDVEAAAGEMVYTYTYDQPANPENGTNLKFEIYGIRHTADGTEQRSAASAQTITLK